MRKTLFLTFILFSLFSCSRYRPVMGLEERPLEAEVAEEEYLNRPALVVGITVDQMRYEYLERYWYLFGSGGFKRLVNSGFNFRNHHFSYAPTYTGPGHASIYTGTTPAYHGIIANDWYDKDLGRVVYCSSDSTVSGVGATGISGQMSPRKLKSSTIGDEMKLFSQGKSKVIGISMKDRGAILPAGHQPDGAYWFEGKDVGAWMTSSYYTDDLPQWVKEFNAKSLPDQYLAQGWDLLESESDYYPSNPDNNPYERPFSGGGAPVFPYDLEALRAANGNYDLIKATPHGNTLTVDFALAAIEAEELGQDGWWDLLAISFSSTDYVGHQFGPHARETQDTYMRLDRELNRLFNYLDEHVGSSNYVVFLTADHGGAPVPSQVNKEGWPNDYFSSAALVAEVDSLLKLKLGVGNWLLNYSNEQLFLNEALIRDKGLNLAEIEDWVARQVLDYPGVLSALSGTSLRSGNFTEGPQSRLQAGYNPAMSGNVVLLLQPGWMEYGRAGTTHGSPYSYDTHVPLLMMGGIIPHGQTFRPTRIRDIAPTISMMLHVPLPSACTGEPLEEVLLYDLR